MNQCSVCEGTLYICDYCRLPDGQCTCEDGPLVVPCDVCDGTGEE